MKSKVECIEDTLIIDSNLMSAGEVGLVDGYINIQNRIYAIVFVENKIKYCPIDKLEVI